jgi:polar amino acid transport system ATP-binding protein
MVLEVKGIQKSFKDKMVLQDVSFSLKRGEVTSVIGRSGAGKTTLLRCINALELCDCGSITIDGTDLCREESGRTVYNTYDNIKAIRKKIGMVFQNLNLFPHKSTLENIIEAPVNVYGLSRAEAERKAYQLMGQLGISDKSQSYPYQLSGGQKQRVAIARACALNPSIMCFDEPTSALDPELKESIACIIEKLASENIAVLIITHDMNFAKRVSDSIVFMEAGKVIQEGRKDEFVTNPVNDMVERYINSV